MPLPAVPNVFKVTIGGFCDPGKTQNWANVLHFQYSGPAPSSSQLAATAAQIVGQFQNNMAALIVFGSTIEFCNITDLTSPTAGEATSFQSLPGSRGDDQIPANAALLIHYQVNYRYRGGKPRTYLLVGGFADLQDSVHWHTTFVTSVVNAWKAFLGAISGFSTGTGTLGQHVLVRYRDKGLNPTPPHNLTSPLVLPLQTSTLFGDAEVASQRGRIGRSKRNAGANVP